MTSLPSRIYKVKLPPGTVVNQHIFPANIAGVVSRSSLCLLAASLQPWQCIKTTWWTSTGSPTKKSWKKSCACWREATRKTALIRGWVEVVNAADSLCIRSFTIKRRQINRSEAETNSTILCALNALDMIFIDWNEFYPSIVHWENRMKSFTLCFPKFLHVTLPVIISISIFSYFSTQVQAQFLSFVCFFCRVM